MDNIKVLFGKRVKELRKKIGYTQAQLAEIANVDDKHISCIEGGKNFPSPDLLDRLANSLNVEVKALFEFDYLKEPENLKVEIQKIINQLTSEQLRLVYKYVKTFIL